MQFVVWSPRAVALRVLLLLILAAFLLFPGASPVVAAGGHLSSGFWAQYDRAVYVVSTLNVPSCAERRQPAADWHARAMGETQVHYESLASMLQARGARVFDVLSSKAIRDLFFIAVRDDAGRLLSVYAYRIGWPLPRSVAHPGCIPLAPPTVIHAYTSGRYTLVARFTSTLPSLD
jgi:hypothetical protein